MFLKLVLAFTLIPLTEIYILMKLGVHFGIGITLLVVVGTGVLGAYLARREGFRALNRIQHEMNSGKLPAVELIDALLIFISGIGLLTPGLLTDIAGFLILFPLTRNILKKKIVCYMKKNMQPTQTYMDADYHIED